MTGWENIYLCRTILDKTKAILKLKFNAFIDFAEKRELLVNKHHGFWKCMDAMRDKIVLDELWEKTDQMENMAV